MEEDAYLVTNIASASSSIGVAVLGPGLSTSFGAGEHRRSSFYTRGERNRLHEPRPHQCLRRAKASRQKTLPRAEQSVVHEKWHSPAPARNRKMQ
nr:hypothetical protein Iba_chr11eCG6350 [Ipomoea batatas]